jgi:plasmid stability protein
MANQTLTINFPDDLYGRLKKRAEETHRTIEDEVIGVLEASTPDDERLPVGLVRLLDFMALMDDETLWRIAESNTLTREAHKGLQQLRAKSQGKGLTPAEEQRQTDLLEQYDEGVLIRSKALALLKQRGRNIDALLVQP